MLRICTSMVALPVCALTLRAHAGITEFTNFLDWEAASRPFTTIEFDEVPHLTFVTDQYSDLGVLFTDGTDLALCCDPDTFADDGAGLAGNPDINLEFGQAMYSLGIHHVGGIRISLYLEGTPVFTSQAFVDDGAIGAFAGLVSDVPFDFAVLEDPFDDAAYIDDLHFGPPIPAPGSALFVMLVVGSFVRRRAR